MTASVALGWDVCQAMNGKGAFAGSGGGMFVTGGSNTWSEGWGHTPASVLQLVKNAIYTYVGEGPKRIWVADGTLYDANLITGLESAGHTVTIGSSPITLSYSNYDFAMFVGSHNVAGANAALQADNIWNFIGTEGGGAIFPCIIPGEDSFTLWNSTLMPHLGMNIQGSPVMGAGWDAYVYLGADELWGGIDTIWIRYSLPVALLVGGPDFGSVTHYEMTASGYGYYYWINGSWRKS
jgi:hypothetical protein